MSESFGCEVQSICVRAVLLCGSCKREGEMDEVGAERSIGIIYTLGLNEQLFRVGIVGIIPSEWADRLWFLTERHSAERSQRAYSAFGTHYQSTLDNVCRMCVQKRSRYRSEHRNAILHIFSDKDS